jgi:regulator of sigma E protease
MYIVIAVLVFGLLITLHELGHFAAAKTLGVRVYEFAVGMGPILLKKQGKETKYSLRLLPIGGFCAMEEDSQSDDPGAFTNKPMWKRFIILFAGSFMNLLAGILIIIVLLAGAQSFTTTTIDGLMDGFPNTESKYLQAGDTIYKINGQRIYLTNDISTFLSRADGTAVDLTVIRDGKKVLLDDFPLTLRDYEVNGQTVQRYGFYLRSEEATFGVKLKYSYYNSIYFVRLVELGLSDLVSGHAKVKDLSGPVGIVSMISQVGESSKSVSQAAEDIAYICAFIAINLAVMNLLPIPALDGARIFFMFVTWIIQKLTRRRVDPKYEGYIHAAGFALLMGLMVFVLYNDVSRLIT